MVWPTVRSRGRGLHLEPVVVRVLFPSVFVEVLVQVFVEFLILLRQLTPSALSIILLNVSVNGLSQILGANVLRFTADSLRLAANVVSGGGLIVFPTDTVYGLGCDPMNGSAVQKLFEVKGRASKPIPLLCESLQKASELVELSPIARGLAKKFWPGALTVVAPLKLPVPFPLHQGSGTLGVRVPGGHLCLELIRECGGLLTGTSANLSGRPSSMTAQQASDQLGGSVDLILDGGPTGATESTVVQVVGDKIVVLRQGQVGVTDELRGT